jgi:cysteine desulfurase
MCPSDETINGPMIVKHMNLAGIAISAGSACNSGKLQPSPTLSAMGYEPRLAQAGLRISLGLQTSKADIDWTAIALRQIIHRLVSKPAVVAQA